ITQSAEGRDFEKIQDKTATGLRVKNLLHFFVADGWTI
ncbi:hypothetical protein EVA_12203, partial [gut metagenome]